MTIFYGRTTDGRICPKNVLERLWENSIGDSDDECWETTHVGQSGAGHVRIRLDDKSRIMTHRLAWEAYHAEPIPKGLIVCHRCDNPKCFNPHHLFVGTHKDNTDDMWAKGRGNPPSKLSKEQRVMIANSSLPSKILAAQYGVTSERLNQIKRGV
jgi:hypothetical protein